MWREYWELSTERWSQMSTMLMSLAHKADLLCTDWCLKTALPTSLSTKAFRWPRWITFHNGPTASS